MSAVVRVKRRVSEEPLNSFVLNCKKRKIDDERTADANEEVSTLLHFAGTVKSQDINVHIPNRLTKDEAKNLVQKVRKPMNVTEKSRQEMRDNLHENRFRVVNCYRTTQNNSSEEESNNSNEITIFDVEKNETETIEINRTATTTTAAAAASESLQQQQQPSSSSSSSSINHAVNSNYTNSSLSADESYVYDLYLPENEQNENNASYLENYSSIRFVIYTDHNLVLTNCYL